MSSRFFVPHPLIASLVKIERFLNSERRWHPSNENQRKFIRDIYSERGLLALFREWELKAYADTSADRLNEILKQENFDIRLDDFGPNGIGSVSILKVIFKWLNEAVKCSFSNGGKKYEAMKFEDGFSVYTSPSHGFLIAKIETLGGYEVFITPQGDRRSIPLDGFALYDAINAIMRNASMSRDATEDNDFLKAPILKIDTIVDSDWMIGLKSGTSLRNTVVIEQVKEQLKLEMDEKGMKIDAAAAMGTRSAKSGITINEPFYMLVRKKGLVNGVVYGFIDTDVWVEERK